MPAAFFFTYYAPRLTTTAKAPLSELPYIDKSLVSLEKALVGLRENKGLIAREESVFHYTPPLAHRSHWSFVTRDEIYPPVAPYTSPEACADQIARGSHVYRSWTTTEGTVHVVIMLATSGQSGEQLCNVLESVNYYCKPIKAAAKN